MANLPKADKDLGQHFLKDKNVIEKITTDFQDQCDVIVEVGPGPAILSKELAAKEKPYYFKACLVFYKSLIFYQVLLQKRCFNYILCSWS